MDAEACIVVNAPAGEQITVVPTLSLGRRIGVRASVYTVTPGWGHLGDPRLRSR